MDNCIAGHHKGSRKIVHSGATSISDGISTYGAPESKQSSAIYMQPLSLGDDLDLTVEQF